MNIVMTGGRLERHVSLRQRRDTAPPPSLDQMLSLLRATLVGLGPIHPSLDLRSQGGKS